MNSSIRCLGPSTLRTAQSLHAAIRQRGSLLRPPPFLLRYALCDGLVACRSECVTADAAGGVRVFPLDRPSIGGVGVDVAPEFASQVGKRGEDAARDDLAFDLGEPDLDLVEPGRVSGREVKPDSRMLLEE